jgi:L-gulonate 3-dehydrogenase
MSERAAIVGAGLIGRAWAIAFARGGWQVALWDPDAAALARSHALIGELLADMAAAGLVAADAAQAIAARIEPKAELAAALARSHALIGELLADMAAAGLVAADAAQAIAARIEPKAELAAALAEAAWVQENAPERLETKRTLWAELDRIVPAEVVLASSTSALLPSAFTDHLAHRGRCLVAHPLNPPYLIPAIELVPAPWTAAEAMDRADLVMRAIGQRVIRMTRELPGFVMNRLQAALMEEAVKLVAAGYCDAEEVDIGLRDGLALRWSFMGPFETADLNAPGGVRDYVTRYRSVFDSIAATPLPRPDWTGPVLERIETARTIRLLRGADHNAARQRWRDRRLMALLAHKREASETIGD